MKLLVLRTRGICIYLYQKRSSLCNLQRLWRSGGRRGGRGAREVSLAFLSSFKPKGYCERNGLLHRRPTEGQRVVKNQQKGLAVALKGISASQGLSETLFWSLLNTAGGQVPAQCCC